MLSDRRKKTVRRGDAILWADLPYLKVVRAVACRLEERFRGTLCFIDPCGRPVFPLGKTGLIALRNSDSITHGCVEVGESLHGGKSASLVDELLVGGADVIRTLHRRCSPKGWRLFQLEDGSMCLGAPLLPGTRPGGAAIVGGFMLDGFGPEAAGNIGEEPKLPWVWEGKIFSWTADMLGGAVELLLLATQDIREFKGEVDKRERRWGKGRPSERELFSEIVGESAAMMELFRTLARVVASDSTVLIRGENGTGKELVARAIHENSSRSGGNFIVQDFSALNENLLNTELFGHLKGAFTGAVCDKRGLFETADRGTFFLDEIGEMRANLQVKLLRVLQEGTFLRVGGSEPVKVDVRVLAATNRNLEKMVEKGEFREDLYYRLNVIEIRVPPLRDRKEDIPLLIDHFFTKRWGGGLVGTKRFSDGALKHLLEYDWPGNVRELENELERLAVLAGDEVVIEENLISPRIRDRSFKKPKWLSKRSGSMVAAVEELEKSMIENALKKHRWNKSRAAVELEVSRRNLLRKIKRYGLERRKAK